MATKTVTISEKEYKRLKKSAETEDKLMKQLVKSLEDIKAGRIKRVH